MLFNNLKNTFSYALNKLWALILSLLIDPLLSIHIITPMLLWIFLNLLLGFSSKMNESFLILALLFNLYVDLMVDDSWFFRLLRNIVFDLLGLHYIIKSNRIYFLLGVIGVVFGVAFRLTFGCSSHFFIYWRF